MELSSPLFVPQFPPLAGCRWLAESARWLVLSGKAERAVKVLQRVARINKKKEEGEKITVEVLWPPPGGALSQSGLGFPVATPLTFPRFHLSRT